MFEGLFQPMHLIIILAIVLIVFGPGKLPDIGGALGRGIKEFKTSVNDEANAPTKAETVTTTTTTSAAPVNPVAPAATVATPTAEVQKQA